MSSNDQTRIQQRPVTTDAATLQRTLLGTLHARTTHRGEIHFPCIPAPVEHYVHQLRTFFANLGKSLSPEELGQLRALLKGNLEQGFHAAAGAQLIVKYETTVTQSLLKNLACSVAVTGSPATEQYQGWRESTDGTRTLFGAHPDARIISLVEELGDPRMIPILDVGAGNGRNALPLARRGHPVDAVEPTPGFAEELRRVAQAEGLPIKVIASDFFDPRTTLPASYYQVVVLAEVVSHFRDASQLRQLFVRMADCLAENGFLLFNLFLTLSDYEPDALARQMGEVGWSSMFTRRELDEAMNELPFTVISDEAVIEYERAHLPATAWPPTPWFESWASGQSVFPVPHGRPPIELRWILLRRHAI